MRQGLPICGRSTGPHRTTVSSSLNSFGRSEEQPARLALTYRSGSLDNVSDQLGIVPCRADN
jgi:hypothetical protein